MDAYIDPTTRDYSLTGGKLTPDPARGLANAAYFRLMTPLGSYWAEPTLGSRLHELQREKDVVRVTRLAQQYAEQALQLLVDDGRVTALGVEVVRQPGRLLLLITLTASDGRSVTFQHPVSIAG